MPLLGMTTWLHATEDPGDLVMMLILAIAVCVTLVLWAGAWALLAAASTGDRRRPQPGSGRRRVRHGRDSLHSEPVGAPPRWRTPGEL